MQYEAKDGEKIRRHIFLAAVPQAQETEQCDSRVH